MSAYRTGLDALSGDGILDFIPALNVVSKLTSGGSSPAAVAAATPAASAVSTDAAKKAAAAQVRTQRAVEKAEAEAKKTRTILYIVLGSIGILGLGGTAVLLLKRK